MRSRCVKSWWSSDRANPLGRSRGRQRPKVFDAQHPAAPVPMTAFKPENVQPGHQHDTGVTPARIRCPLCNWQPSRSTRWYCSAMGAPENFSGGCGHGWNTFDTRGLCPGCNYQWRHTWCFSCSRPSPHDDWYVAAGKQRRP